jgi:hypothetical protein
MFTLLRMLRVKRFFLEQGPALVVAWLVAELFYKFHSFSLECAAFLATWFVLDALLQGFLHLFRADRARFVPVPDSSPK